MPRFGSREADPVHQSFLHFPHWISVFLSPSLVALASVHNDRFTELPEENGATCRPLVSDPSFLQLFAFFGVELL
jgi:hypothetical protein